MNDKAKFSLRGRNPDVLTCIANLSNDEVFTPPELANKMLDTLAEAWANDNGGADIWADSSVRFLDPCTKSGVFLREITSRLVNGLSEKIPDLDERVDHILTKQVFGIAITQLTAQLARRSVYCSKFANGRHSIARSFENTNGNIWFERTEHTWIDGRCSFCGANITVFSRGPEAETHAYRFIHNEKIRPEVSRVFGSNMKFDVVVGNPPYQLTDASSSASASPIYHLFIQKAIELGPSYITMVTPSRWFVGGKGLDEFRDKMLKDQRISNLVDFIVEKDAIPGINVNGGLSYFLWDAAHSGPCAITTIEQNFTIQTTATRRLDEFDVFVRRSCSAQILRKVLAKSKDFFSERVFPRRPFGLSTNFFGRDVRDVDHNLKLYSSGKVTWIRSADIVSRGEIVDAWKVLVARATDGNEKYPLPIWDLRGPFVAGPGEACTETYLVASLAKDEMEAHNIVRYMRTILFRFLVSLRKPTQDNKADVFAFVPDLPMDRPWEQTELEDYFDLSIDERHFMRDMVREMDFKG